MKFFDFLNLQFQDLEKIDDLINILREIDAFLKAIVDSKKIEKRREKLNRKKRISNLILFRSHLF